MGTWSEFMPLGGKHIKDKSGKKNVTLKKSVSGKSVLGSLSGASYQKQLSGKNLLKPVLTTSAGITFEPLNNGFIHIYGKSTGNWHTMDGMLAIDGTNVSITISWTEAVGFSFGFTNSGYVGSIDSNNPHLGRILNVASTANHMLTVQIPTDTTVDFTIGIQAEYGTVATEFEPYCGGTASPNPDYPQTIHSTGDSGWFDGELEFGTLASTDGTEQAYENLRVRTVNYIPCKAGDVIEVSCGNETLDWINVFYYSDDSYISYAPNGASFLAPEGATRFRVVLARNSGLSLDIASKMSITINGKYAVIVDEVGKNLQPSISVSTSIQGVPFTLNGDGSITANGTASSDAFLVLPDVTLEAGEYIVSSGATGGAWDKYMYYFGIDGVYYWDNDGNDKEFVLEKKTVISPRIVVRGGVTAQTTFYPMIRPVGTSDTYTPYQHNRTYIPISEPLRSVGEIKDEICVQNGEYGVLRRVPKGKFSDFDFSIYNTNGYLTGDLKGIIKPKSTILSDKYLYSGNTWESLKMGVDVNGVVWVGDIDFDDTNGYFVYIALNPVFTPFADQTPFYNLLSYDDVTNVSIVGFHENVEPTLQMFYPSSEDGVNVFSLIGNNSQLRFNNETGTIQVIDTDGDWIDIYFTDSIPVPAWDGSILGNTLKFPASKWSIVNYTASGETSGGATLELSTQYLKLDRGSGVNYQSVLYLPVNVTNCKTLHITGHSVRLGSYYNAGDAWIQKVVPDGSKLNGGAGDIQSCRWNTGTAWIDPTSFTLDVSDLTGIYYICISNAGYEGYTEITELYFDLL